MIGLFLKTMLGCIPCRCLAESHILVPLRASCHAYEPKDAVISDTKCTPILPETAGVLGPKVLQSRKFVSQCCCSRQRSELWMLGKWNTCLEKFCFSSGEGTRIPCSTAPASPGKFLQVFRTGGKVEYSALRVSVSTTFINTLLARPKLQIRKFIQCTKKAGGDNTAIETSFNHNAEYMEIESPSSADGLNSNPLPGMIYPPMTTVGKSTNIVWQECMVKKEERQKLLGQKGCVIWITGLSGSGKSSLACTLDHALLNRGKLSYVLDGDNVRHGLNKNLGFTADDRAENIRRVGEVAKLFVDAGVICIASVISPYRKDRDSCRNILRPEEFIEVYMNFPLSTCEERDPKGLYKLARAGKIKGFTGIDDPYEVPLNCEIVMEPIGGRCPTPAEMAAHLITYLEQKGFLEILT